MNKFEDAVKQSDLAHRPQKSNRGLMGARRSPNTSHTDGFLGVLVDRFGQRSVDGASVVGTIAGSAAARVGLGTGDTFTAVSGVGLVTGAPLGALISARDPGEHMTVTWITPQGTAHFASVRLSRDPSKRPWSTDASKVLVDAPTKRPLGPSSFGASPSQPRP